MISLKLKVGQNGDRLFTPYATQGYVSASVSASAAAAVDNMMIMKMMIMIMTITTTENYIAFTGKPY